MLEFKRAAHDFGVRRGGEMGGVELLGKGGGRSI